MLALKFKDGIMMSADTLASYGSLARFKDIQRLKPVGDYTVVGAGGDMSDFQYLEKTLESAVYVRDDISPASRPREKLTIASSERPN